MTRIRARKAKTPATIPTTEPRRILPTFSLTSALASSTSSRIRLEAFSETSKTSSPTDLSSVGFGGVTPGPDIVAYSGGSSSKTALPDDRGEPCRGDAGEGAGPGQHSAPYKSFHDVVVHTRFGLDLTYRGSRPSQIVATTKSFAFAKSESEAGITVEDPAREQLLDRAVEGHRGEGGVDVGAEGAGLLALLDDPRDRVVGAADLPQVGLAEGVGGPGDLDDDHLHQFRVVAVGLDDEVGDVRELFARRLAGVVGLVDRGQQQRPALGEELVQHLLLGVEVVVDQPVGDPRLVGDVGDPGRVEALAGEDLDRRVEDLAPLVDRGGFRGHQACASTSWGQA